MNLFYIQNIEVDKEAFLDEEESRHCIKVLRMQAGDNLDITDGEGFFYRAKITDPSSKKCRIWVEKKFLPFNITTPKVHIAIAPTKNISRFEWFLEKAVEIGIDEITPLCTFHSERKNIKPDRLNKIMVAAMKQSLRATLPLLHPMQEFYQFIRTAEHPEKYFAYCGEGEKRLLQHACRPGTDALIMIGPEGGYTEKEAKEALQQGFRAVSLGNARLRTETAGIVACTTLRLLNEKKQYTASKI
ncbi:MAG: 16S rRNA (uracil(1498)-N(3))-methyltransferase [Bacteroidales bacterium]|nr:16S rRNA (uracil(1498)-N(3))-methyltransferase [Bacteroidales bacterium]MDD2322499.1 16S rRNA (uracil(1498)-N(3))-methyltransferase [Bacteroidales bacterium]MDD3009927.1 16S rRNA (uracil(1498)-N(3))-methyltransferase [Bacteroidales bacterium]MDD3960483.1 16S rRNA (uracil(1498)-N(3))-methyltransferase [Bacteroidales bacterium]MDY0285068.1 16S rRNA (uracil(1498)-N(3))-methyltransferase [Bacteroidales bacterium]